MKFIIVTFADKTDLSSLPIDSKVTVGSVPNGTIMVIGDTANAEAELASHHHELGGVTGPPIADK